ATTLNFQIGKARTLADALSDKPGAPPPTIEGAGIDVLATIGANQPPMLVGYGMKAVSVPAAAWDLTTADQLRKRLKTAKVQTPLPMFAQRLPVTYLFQSAQGRMG